jgi:hypothetical protein
MVGDLRKVSKLLCAEWDQERLTWSRRVGSRHQPIGSMSSLLRLEWNGQLAYLTLVDNLGEPGI